MTLTNGLVVMTPTSVDITGGGSETSTTNADGSVSFSACATLSLNGVFTSDYDNYMVTVRWRNDGASNVNVNCRLRLSGADNTTASSYTRQRIEADNTTVAGSRTSDTFAYFASTGTANRDGAQAFMFGPYLAQPTAVRTVTMTGRDGSRLYDSAFTHNQSTAYDGFTLYPTGGSIEGLITVFGFNQ